ncbi:hypothetical protein LCGC14_2682140 [marine sediment metagenome]|uniref:Four helix bundle protein n=1 Tax=marine sediment metagenome TaxID=412755 RepID=A0A0F8ZL30_9ZZZZ
MDKAEHIIYMIGTIKSAIIENEYLFPERKTDNKIKIEQLNYILERCKYIMERY